MEQSTEVMDLDWERAAEDIPFIDPSVALEAAVNRELPNAVQAMKGVVAESTDTEPRAGFDNNI